MREMLVAHLGRRGFAVIAAGSVAEALALVEQRELEVVVADVRMPVTSGVELCVELVGRDPSVAVILMTGFGSMDTAIDAIRAGARDFLPKPFRLDQLVRAIERVVRARRVTMPAGFGELVGTSPRMLELYELLGKVAASDVPALISGETGTGKELIARALHMNGPRKDGPLVAINCAAMPAALLESELFGHVRGAFTDARSDRTGLLVAAHGGTLFFDEIGELPLELQPKLLRAIQERSVRPLGGSREVAFDARIVAATNRDLSALADAGGFRRDLLFRLDVIGVPVPALRERGGDIELLASHFLERCAARAHKRITGFTPEAARQLASYAWPGNVRELANCIERAVALTSGDRIAVDDLPETVRSIDTPIQHDEPSTVESSALVTLAEVERCHVRRVLAAVAGNKSAAARVLGIERRTLYRMLSRERDPFVHQV